MATDDDERIVPPDLVYVFFIRSTAQQVWDALTTSEFEPLVVMMEPPK